jgi:hypothetical protein
MRIENEWGKRKEETDNNDGHSGLCKVNKKSFPSPWTKVSSMSNVFSM